MLAHLMDLGGMRGLPASPGEAVTRFRGDASSAGRFYIWPKFIVTQLLVSIVAVAIMVSISPFVTLIGLLPIILVYVVVHFARTRIERTRKQSREAAGEVTGFLGEMFGSAEAIKVAGAENHVLNEFDRVNAARKRATLRGHAPHSDAERRIPQLGGHRRRGYPDGRRSRDAQRGS